MLLLLPLLLPAHAEDAVYDLGDDIELPAGATVWTAGLLVNLRAGFAADSPVLARLPAATRVKVLDEVSDRVEVKVGARVGWIDRELLSPMGRETDLDGDGVPERVVIDKIEDAGTVAWVREGDVTSRVVLTDVPDPYLGSWALVPAEEAGVPLLRVALSQDACGGFPVVWLSYRDGKAARALETQSWGDGGDGDTFDVRFPAPGKAVVHDTAYLDGAVVAERDQACTLEGGVFRCG